jgi:hypothetical protein
MELDAIRKLTMHTTIDFTAADYRLPQFAPWEVNDTNDAIRYSEGWTLWRGPHPLGGTLHYANRAGCTVEMAFQGREIALIHKIGPDCGVAEITIDGAPAPLAPRIDTYGRDVHWNAVTPLAKELAPGRHTVTIRVTGEKHNASSNRYVQVVGFEVRGEG